MVDLYFYSVYILSGLLGAVSSLTAVADDVINAHPQQKLVQQLDMVNQQLQSLSHSVRRAQNHITTRQLEECSMMGPMSDSICDLFLLDKSLAGEEAVQTVVHRPLAPGKRADTIFQDQHQRNAYLEDLLQKQKLLDNILEMVEKSKEGVQMGRKRSCNVNLGFHCQTEQYSAIADMYNWLQSSLSPGKRRKRRAAAYKNLPHKL
ncbi:uncharacterized protein LOC128232966 [Mya arenaria]|uniref:uncharacterized protein LOC128232966 n=1 Tax=Mya arenaria TaxID=6604 RepID=UPI0022E09D05|nr:uncharacterized protein LOC128232966 [Mya arenaria]